MRDSVRRRTTGSATHDDVAGADDPSGAATVVRPRRRFRLAAWPGRLSTLMAAVVIAATAGTALAGSAPSGGPLTVDESSCGAPSSRLSAGPISFDITDDARVFAAVYLINPAGDVYAEIPWISPGRTLALATTLGAGRYAVRCVFSDGAVLTSPQVTVAGSTTGAVAGYRPLPDLAMTQPVTAYRDWIRAALPKLLAACRALDADIARGDLPAAKADWLTAHLDYERLGAAYNSFGDFDGEIDGMANGLPQGVATPGWTGFFSIEYGLWHGRSAARLRPLTRNLVSDVNGLIQDFPSEEVDPGDLPLRAHEILENALQFQLTGIADYGSGTALATVYANTQGTEEVLSVLAPLIRPRDASLLTSVDQDMALVQADLLASRAPDGTWTALSRIDTARRQRLDGDLGQLLEQLAVVPNLLAPRTDAGTGREWRFVAERSATKPHSSPPEGVRRPTASAAPGPGTDLYYKPITKSS
jgi:iron uptake system EfeUOB component EfeO/EfeM